MDRTSSRSTLLRCLAYAVSTLMIASVAMHPHENTELLERPSDNFVYPSRYSQLHQGFLQALAEKCKSDNPLSEISEPNVFSGPVGWGPDWPKTSGPEPDCSSMKMSNFRKTYEIAEPNFSEWKEFEPDYNVFPYTAGKSGPDAPKPIAEGDNIEKIFDGHGGIIGLEDSMHWSNTPDSVAPKKYGKYADGGSTGMDHNVLANGYKFPDY